MAILFIILYKQIITFKVWFLKYKSEIYRRWFGISIFVPLICRTIPQSTSIVICKLAALRVCLWSMSSFTPITESVALIQIARIKTNNKVMSIIIQIILKMHLRMRKDLIKILKIKMTNRSRLLEVVLLTRTRLMSLLTIPIKKRKSKPKARKKYKQIPACKK